ncbi:transcription factor IIA, alpha/beta subunit [Pholiota conissans]|uniref:Transcription factor IIA, alpha/beta subunit n=1 Tax=Pholiota conissans TaxID=109636 RepID=A0A9P5Z5Y7_9AGAR|nr:transcription factor IIA, alpha/beta subunit [Pholiota conissans]
MSNKIVPSIYRAVIDEVVNAIKPEFEEYGVAEDVLAELQRKWENKVIASHVADFENQQSNSAPSATHPSIIASAQQHQQHQQLSYPPHPMHMMPHYGAHNPYAPVAASSQPAVKTEPVDNRYILNTSYSLPPLPGPNINGNRQLPPPVPSGSIMNFPRNGLAQPGVGAARPYTPATSAQPAQRIPQVDGPSESSGEEESPSPPPSGQFAPRSAHPSLPQPAAASQSSTVNDSEAINSDLDDSDTEAEDDDEEGAAGETDIVFCTYDKVARVKNKWKCVLKDGMIHINGKDYLFAKCTGEFEW